MVYAVTTEQSEQDYLRKNGSTRWMVEVEIGVFEGSAGYWRKDKFFKHTDDVNPCAIFLVFEYHSLRQGT